MRLTPTVTEKKVKELYTPVPPNQPQSIAVPGSQKPGHSPIYRHWKFQDGVLETLDPNIRTIHQSFEAAVETYPKNKCLGHRPYNAATKSWGDYVWLDYQTVAKKRTSVGAGLVQLHRQAGLWGGKFGVGLWCLNRPEWQITG